MITKLVTGGSKSFKPLLTIFRKLSIIRRQERERLVLELYNQGKTIREIAKEARMSFRDIGAILNKTLKEKTEATKEQGQDNTRAQCNQQENLSLSAQAYKLFSDRKTPLEVAIALNLTLKSFDVHKSIHGNSFRIHSNNYRRNICSNITLHHCHISALEETRSNRIIR
jgi:transposase